MLFEPLKLIVFAVIVGVIGIVLGFFLGVYYQKKQKNTNKEKQDKQIQSLYKSFEEQSKKQIEVLLTSLGKKPSKEQVNRIFYAAQQMRESTGDKKIKTRRSKKK